MSVHLDIRMMAIVGDGVAAWLIAGMASPLVRRVFSPGDVNGF